MSVGATEQRVANLPQIALSLLVLAALCDLATHIERIDKRIEVRAVIRYRRQVDLLAFGNSLDDVLPYLGRLSSRSIITFT